MTRLRWLSLIGVAITVTSVTGCAQAVQPVGGDPDAKGWQEPPSYTYTVDSQCGERLLIGQFRLAVEAGKVVRAEGLNDRTRELVTSVPITSFPTLGQLFEEYLQAQRDGAEVATAALDPTDGHPTRIDIDSSKMAVDDEACYVITDYAVNPSASVPPSPTPEPAPTRS